MRLWRPLVGRLGSLVVVFGAAYGARRWGGSGPG
jgi:hypothetical protein